MTPQELLNLQDYIAGFSALMKGSLDVEIEALRAENEKLQDKLGLIKTLDQADQVKAEADVYAIDTKAAADEATAAAAQLTADAADLDITSRAKDASLRAREAQLVQDRSDFEVFAEKEGDRLNTQWAHLQDLEASLDALKQTLTDRADALAAREIAVEQKMQAFRAIAA